MSWHHKNHWKPNWINSSPKLVRWVFFFLPVLIPVEAVLGRFNNWSWSGPSAWLVKILFQCLVWLRFGPVLSAVQIMTMVSALKCWGIGVKDIDIPGRTNWEPSEWNHKRSNYEPKKAGFWLRNRWSLDRVPEDFSASSFSHITMKEIIKVWG
jgi:hypothetical protein